MQYDIVQIQTHQNIFFVYLHKRFGIDPTLKNVDSNECKQTHEARSHVR